MNALWAVFSTAVLKAQADHTQEMRRTRDLSRIAQALEDIVDRGYVDPAYLPTQNAEPKPRS